MKKILKADFDKFRENARSQKHSSKVSIAVCCGTGCSANNGGAVYSALKNESAQHNVDVSIFGTGCHGFCERGPLVVVRVDGGKEKNKKEIFYQLVKPEDAGDIVKKVLARDEVVERLLYVDPVTNQKIVEESEVPFYKYQKRLILGNNGKIDPTRITDYIAVGGYSALVKALSMKPEFIIDEIKKSGLRGRGGAGFATGLKWELCRKASGSTEDQEKVKYIICNADEGDPGAFMDRSIIEGNPHSIIEGMIIGAYAICSETGHTPYGYIYIRHEYPLARKNLQIALDQAEEHGLLGENILGSGFNFSIRIHQGAGAFVCGEETALISSIENNIGRPVPRPPYPVECGLFGQPTNINNVKTWAQVSLIVNNGAQWYSGIGTETSKGTMIFSLVGKIANTGLIEVPMGITLRDILYKIGGGVPDKKFKVQVGGPSGGMIPESMLDVPIDYESLKKVGSMMGSGGLIVADETSCMVDMAKYFLSFTQEESCGKCTPCREGTRFMYKILEKISMGKATESDIALLEDTAVMVQKTSLCGLGKTAPNPVISAMKYFRDEFTEHIEHKKCRAKVCHTLISYSISKDKCTGCRICFKRCPSGAIQGEVKKVHVIDSAKCTKCNICFEVCKFDAVSVS